jgi:hypothetical protein
MSATRRIVVALAVVALAGLAFAGCETRLQGTRHAVALGEHQLSIRVPEGWQVLSFGREVRVSHGGVVFTLGDLGPAGPEGIQSEVERAHVLWRKGQDRDARWVLRNVPVPDELFGTQVERTAFWAAWSEVANAPDGADPAAIDEAFERIRANVAALARPDVQVLAGTVLDKIEPKARRDIAASHTRLVAGREAVVFRTWDRLTHGNPRRVAIVFDKGYALKLDTEAGSMAAAGPAFQGLLDSLRFTAPAPAGGPAISGGPAPGDRN